VKYYEMRLLDLMGYRPLLFECAACGEEITARDQYFSADQGGVLCPKCVQRGQSQRQISVDALRYMRHIQRSTYKEASRANPPESIRQEMDALQNYYLTYLLERKLNSPEFLKQINKSL